MQNKFIFFIVILLAALSLSACSRDRLRRSTDVPAPTQVINTQAVIEQTTATQSVQLPASVDTATLPPSTPSPTPVSATQSPDLANDLSELEDILKDLNQILGDTDTNVNIP
jgi:hypothetical protein